MIFKWVKIDINNGEYVTEPATHVIATPKSGCWLGVVKMIFSVYPSYPAYSQEFQIFFGNRQMTGNMCLKSLTLNLDGFHEVFCGEKDEPLKIVTSAGSIQGFCLLSESEG